MSRRRKMSDYGVMLREKQKVKRIYGVAEKQFENYFKKASAKKGVTGEVLLQLLESRLDNIVYRMGFADSRRQARQLVNHGIFSVKGRKTDVSSRNIKPGEEISVTQSKKKLKYFEDFANRKARDEYAWVEADFKNLKGKYLNLPIREQLDPDIQEQLIVEFYSK